MSLGFVVKVPEGLVLAAESRVTLAGLDEHGKKQYESTYDNATKLLSFSPPHHFIGVVTYGQAVIGGRTAYGYLIELEEQLPKGRISVYDFAKEISQFFMAQWETAEKPPGEIGNMDFLVAGYSEKEAHGHIYHVQIPGTPEPVEWHPTTFGGAYGGDLVVVSRLMHGIDINLKNKIESMQILSDDAKTLLLSEVAKLQLPVIYPALSLQDAVDLAILNIRTTIDAQKLAVLQRTCGGPIDVCTITRADGLRYVQQKQIKGENKARL